MASSSSSMYTIRSLNVAHAMFIVVLILDTVSGHPVQNVTDSQLLTQKINANRTIVVDPQGKGDCKTIQSAIDSVPEGNCNWTIIDVKKGVYREKVRVPRNKPYIFMRGADKGTTSIVWSQSSANNYDSASFIVEAQNFIAYGISFKNDAQTGIANILSHNQSVAAFVGAEKVAFYSCGFFSAHNTLLDYKGMHYYEHCYIQGAVDLIFGRAQSIFHGCEVFVIGDKRHEVHGSITAHGRRSAGEDSGVVFLQGKIYGIGDAFLGRAPGAFSRAIFAHTYLSKTIVPQGWTNWSYSGSTDHVQHLEYNCTGPGATSEERASWSKQLTDKEAEKFLSIDFINGKQWLPAWLGNAVN